MPPLFPDDLELQALFLKCNDVAELRAALSLVGDLGLNEAGFVQSATGIFVQLGKLADLVPGGAPHWGHSWLDDFNQALSGFRKVLDAVSAAAK